MTFSAYGITHGAIGFFKEVVERAVAAGWTRVESIDDRGLLAASATTLTATQTIDYNVAGLAVNVWYELPVMFLGTFTAYKNYVTPIAEGVDYDIDRGRGRLRIRVGGQLQVAGVGNGRFTVPAGYEIKNGWVVLGSVGSGGSEALRIGLRFASLNSNAANPLRCGPRLSLFRLWSVGVTDYDSVSLSVRNAAADDVCLFVSPEANIDDFQMSATLNRLIVSGRSVGYTAWGYIGAMSRYRPTTEQDYVAIMVGNRGTVQEGADGPVGKTNEPGVMGANHGSVWLYDLGVFSSVTNPVELNANYMAIEAGSTTLGYTTSKRLLNTPGSFGTPQYYFELHDPVVARNLTAINSVTNMVYGGYDGLKMPLIYGARHGLEVLHDGIPYRVWSVGSSWTRFVAAVKV